MGGAAPSTDMGTEAYMQETGQTRDRVSDGAGLD